MRKGLGMPELDRLVEKWRERAIWSEDPPALVYDIEDEEGISRDLAEEIVTRILEGL